MSFSEPSPFAASRSQLALPNTVTDRLREFLAALIDDIEGPAITAGADTWWSDIAEGLAPAASAPSNLLVVNRLRSIAPFDRATTSWLHDGLGTAGRLFFVEATRHHPERLRATRFTPFDATGTLWAAGLSVIDVHRPVVESGDGGWEFAIGRARVTPVRKLTNEAEKGS